MWAERHGSVKRLSIGLIGLALLWSSGADMAMAQATPPADTGGARERELRDQLKNILQELEELQKQDGDKRPANWKLSPQAVVQYLMGAKLKNGFEVSPKYIGNKRLMEIAVATLTTDRALL